MRVQGTIYYLEVWNPELRQYETLWSGPEFYSNTMMDKPYYQTYTRRLVRVDTTILRQEKGVKKKMIPGRLTEYDHNEIVAAHKAGVPVEQLAAEYERKINTIRTIIRRGDR